MLRVKCIKESSYIFVFKFDHYYTANSARVNDENVLVLNEGIFQIVLKHDEISGTWKNSREDVEFVFIGEAEHY